MEEVRREVRMGRIEQDVERLVEDLDFELISFERAGGRRRPLVRVRIDVPGGSPGRSAVTVEDCARVSRQLERYLEERSELPDRSIVEVSSPGVERPLVRRADYARFAGKRVFIQGYAPVVGQLRGVEGVLLGLAEDDRDQVEMEVAGERVRIPVAAIAKANLVHDWEADLRG